MNEAEGNHSTRRSTRSPVENACGGKPNWKPLEEAVAGLSSPTAARLPRNRKEHPKLRLLRRIHRQNAAEDDAFVAMRAGKLRFQWRLVADGPFAEWKSGDPSFLRGFQRLDEATRSWECASAGDPHWRIAADRLVVREFRVDEAQLHALLLGQAATDAPRDVVTASLPEPELTPAAAPEPALRALLPARTPKERFRAWLLSSPLFKEKRVGHIWRQRVLEAARAVDELKDINLNHALLRDMISQDRGLWGASRREASRDVLSASDDATKESGDVTRTRVKNAKPAPKLVT